MTVVLDNTYVTPPPLVLPPTFVTEDEFDFLEGFTPPPGYIWTPDTGMISIEDMQDLWRLDMYDSGNWLSAFNSALLSGQAKGIEDLQSAEKADAYLADGKTNSVGLAMELGQEKTAQMLGIDDVTELSGGILTPMAALAHFLNGNGAPMWTDINNIGLDIELSELPALSNAMQSASEGVTAISLDKVPYNTENDSYLTASWLGNITLKVEGNIVKTGDAVAFDGVVRAYNDIYDANPASFRSDLAENATTVLRAIEALSPAQPYEIQIVGEIPLHLDAQ